MSEDLGDYHTIKIKGRLVTLRRVPGEPWRPDVTTCHSQDGCAFCASNRAVIGYREWLTLHGADIEASHYERWRLKLSWEHWAAEMRREHGYRPDATVQPGDNNTVWTRERIVSVLREIADELGRTPHEAEIRAAHGPSPATLRRTFGSVKAAIKAAGLEPRRKRRRGREYQIRGSPGVAKSGPEAPEEDEGFPAFAGSFTLTAEEPELAMVVSAGVSPNGDVGCTAEMPEPPTDVPPMSVISDPQAPEPLCAAAGCEERAVDKVGRWRYCERHADARRRSIAAWRAQRRPRAGPTAAAIANGTPVDLGELAARLRRAADAYLRAESELFELTARIQAAAGSRASR